MKHVVIGAVFMLVILALASCAPRASDGRTSRWVEEFERQFVIDDERLEEARAANVPVLVRHVRPSAPNTAGGVDVNVLSHNISDRTIKYVVYTVHPFNRVGDVVASEIGGRRSASLRYTGPAESGNRFGGTWRNVWYNYTITCAELLSMTVTFMDDSTVRFDRDEISSVLLTPDVNGCRLP